MSLDVSAITVDNRQKKPKPEAWAGMLGQRGIENRVGFLEVGDFEWTVKTDEGHLIVVEHKTIKDFIGSVEDGRVARFIRADIDQPHTKILLVVWNGGDVNIMARKWHAKTIWSLLLECQAAGVGVVLSKTAGKAVEELQTLYLLLAKEEHLTIFGPKLPVTVDLYFDGNMRENVRFLMAIPGLGEKRARAALTHCGTVGDVLELARNGHLDDVEGIGLKIAARALEFLR